MRGNDKAQQGLHVFFYFHTPVSYTHLAEVPAGGALAVDRYAFSDGITAALRNHPLVEIAEEEITDIQPFLEKYTIVATGPLTSDALSELSLIHI